MYLVTLLQSYQPLIQDYGLIAVFLGVLLEGEITIIIAGILCHHGLLPLKETLFLSILGAFISDQIWFHLGRRYGPALFSKFPRLSRHKAAIAPWVKQKSDWIAFSGRFIYGTRILGYVLLGMNHYSPKRFLLINLVVVTTWSSLGIAIGYFLGSRAENIFDDVTAVEQLILAIIILLTLWHWYKAKKLKHLAEQKNSAGDSP